jgi:hypothetical protein
MKVPINPWNTPQLWRLPSGTAELRIYANTDFVTSDNQLIPAGKINDPQSFYLSVTCTILGNVLTIPSFEIDSTVDALLNEHARYNAVLVAPNGKKVLFISNFAVNTLEPGDPSMDWAEILLFRDMPAPQQSSPSLLRQIAAMISVAAGALTKSNSINTGVTALSVDPLDPVFPIALAANDPLVLDLLSGVGLTIAAGQATLVDGEVTVNEPLVLSTHIICPHSMSNDVNGVIKAPVEEIVDNVSFKIVSSDGGDNGPIGWFITAPS